MEARPWGWERRRRRAGRGTTPDRRRPPGRAHPRGWGGSGGQELFYTGSRSPAARWAVSPPPSRVRMSLATPVRLFQRWLATRAPGSVLFIRLMVGGVFLAEGVQKFLFPAEIGRAH